MFLLFSDGEIDCIDENDELNCTSITRRQYYDGDGFKIGTATTSNSFTDEYSILCVLIAIAVILMIISTVLYLMIRYYQKKRTTYYVE